MNTEKLMELGLTQEQATQVMNLHKEFISGNYIPKATFDAERERVKALNTLIADKDTEISKLSGFKGTNEQLESRLNSLQNTLNEKQQEYEDKISEIENRAAIKLETFDLVYDVDDILEKLDISKINFKDGKVVSGLKEQLNDLKKASPHYFKPVGSEGNKLPNGWNPKGKKPEDGSKDDALLKGEELGKSLAQHYNSAMNVVNKGEEIYFK